MPTNMPANPAQAAAAANSRSRELERIIEKAFEERDAISPATGGEVREAVEAALNMLDKGEARVASRGADGVWQAHQWLKKAVLLSFRLNPNMLTEGPGGANWWDKVPSKFSGWSEADFQKAGIRAVPGAIVRRSAYIAPNVVLMPSFVNLGAYIGEGTMVDTWATVGSCAQIGKNVHISGGAGIGGVLEPLQAGPTIIEDNCFIGARAEVAEGCVIREGAVLGMGVFISQSTKIVDRETGEITYGEVPPYAVVVAGSMASGSGSETKNKSRGNTSGNIERAEAEGTAGGELRSDAGDKMRGKAGAETESNNIGGKAEGGTKENIGGRIMGNGLLAPNLYCAVIVKRADAKTRAKTSINALLRA